MQFPLLPVLPTRLLSVISTQLHLQKLETALTLFNYNYYQNINNIANSQCYDYCIITIHFIDYNAK